jgi:hypothetical protein
MGALRRHSAAFKSKFVRMFLEGAANEQAEPPSPPGHLCMIHRNKSEL